MKKSQHFVSKLWLLLLFCCFSLNFYAQQTDTLNVDEEHYLEMRGMVKESKGQDKDNAHGLDSAEVFVQNEANKTVIFGYTDRKGRCQFRLPLSRKFTIKVTKKGYVTKMIQVETRVPVDKKAAYSFTFDVDIFAEEKGLDVSVLQKPIAKVNYSTGLKTFVYDAMYTNKVNADLKQMYRQYYALQQAEAKAAADSAAAAKAQKAPASPPKN